MFSQLTNNRVHLHISLQVLESIPAIHVCSQYKGRSGVAFHQVFCQCFSPTTVISCQLSSISQIQYFIS